MEDTVLIHLSHLSGKDALFRGFLELIKIQEDMVLSSLVPVITTAGFACSYQAVSYILENFFNILA